MKRKQQMHSLNAIDHNFVLNFAEETLTNWTISRKNEKNRAYTSGKPCINSKISFQAYEEECKEEANNMSKVIDFFKTASPEQKAEVEKRMKESKIWDKLHLDDFNALFASNDTKEKK